jgi:hypothetical protein
MAESDHFVSCEVAADHAVDQPLLVRLVDYPAITCEVRIAPGQKCVQGHDLFDRAAKRVAHENERRIGWVGSYFPYSVAAVAPVLLEDARLAFGEATCDLVPQLLGRIAAVGVTAPTHLSGADQDILRAHREDDVWMRAHQDASVGDLAQYRVELSSVLAILDGVHPNESPVRAQQLIAHFVSKLVVVDRRHGFYSDGAEGIGDTFQPIRIQICSVAILAAAVPHECDFVRIIRHR